MNAPASAINPPKAQAPRIRIVEGTCCATTYGLMKIPEPMMPPMTIIVVSNKPSRRARCASEDVLGVTSYGVEFLDRAFSLRVAAIDTAMVAVNVAITTANEIGIEIVIKSRVTIFKPTNASTIASPDFK